MTPRNTCWPAPISMPPRSGSHVSRNSRSLTLPCQHPASQASGASGPVATGAAGADADGAAGDGAPEVDDAGGAPGDGARDVDDAGGVPGVAAGAAVRVGASGCAQPARLAHAASASADTRRRFDRSGFIASETFIAAARAADS